MRTMKDTPQEARVKARMMPGKVTLNGFIGKDKRSLNDIIEADAQVLQKLGFTTAQIAERLQYFTDASYNSFESKVMVDDIYEVETEVTRGKLPCPYSHNGMYRKSITTLVNITNGVKIRWTSLNIHLIKEHGFFEGKGSTFRLNPEDVIKAVF